MGIGVGFGYIEVKEQVEMNRDDNICSVTAWPSVFSLACLIKLCSV